MKKILLSLILLLFLIIPSRAEYIPKYINPSNNYGEGVITINNSVKIYPSPSIENSPVATVKFTSNEPVIQRQDGAKAPISDFLTAFSYNDNIAVIPVLQNEDEWYKIIYSQSDKLEGWVQKTDDIDYFNWYQFINVYGRKHGLSLFRNVPDEYKKLYASPDVQSNIVDKFNFPKHISVWLVSSSWVLVKVTTYDGNVKTGWLRWRTDNNTLLAFPDFGS